MILVSPWSILGKNPEFEQQCNSWGGGSPFHPTPHFSTQKEKKKSDLDRFLEGYKSSPWTLSLSL